MERKFYKNLFAISVDDFFTSEANKKSFIFQGSKNWYMYLFDKPKCSDYSVFQNVEILSFKEKEDFLHYMKNINLIDYSLEHISELNRYLLLVNSNEY